MAVDSGGTRQRHEGIAPGAVGRSPGFPGRPRLPTRFRPPSVDSKGWREGRQRREARRNASRQRSCRSEEASATRRAFLPEPEAEDDPEASRMRRSEVFNLTATDGRRVRAVRTDSDRRGRGRQPRALREGRGRRTRFRLPRTLERRKAQGRERSLRRRRAPATDSGETANGHEPTEAEDVPRSEARTLIQADDGRRFRRDASASRRNRPGSRRAQPWLPGEAETADPFRPPSVDSGGRREGRRRTQARRIA